MESNSSSVTLVDKTAISLSLLCLLHCLIVPILVPVLPFLVSFEEASHFHEIFAVLVLGIASFAFWRGFKIHGNTSILFFGVLGGCTLSLALLLPGAEHLHVGHVHEAGAHSSEFIEWLGLSISPQSLLTSVGGVLLIVAHLFNIRACKCSLADPECHCTH